MIGNTRERGYTLIEVLIATAVIGLTVTVATQIFLLMFDSQFVLNYQLQLDVKTRQMMSRISDDLYYGYIDYEYFPTSPQDFPEALAIRQPTGEQKVYWFHDDSEGRYALFQCWAPQDDECPIGPSLTPEGHPEWQRVNDYHTQFSEASFSVYPYDDPTGISGPPASDVSPIVVVRMQLQAVEKEETDAFSTFVQTAVTSRAYVR